MYSHTHAHTRYHVVARPTVVRVMWSVVTAPSVAFSRTGPRPSASVGRVVARTPRECARSFRSSVRRRGGVTDRAAVVSRATTSSVNRSRMRHALPVQPLPLSSSLEDSATTIRARVLDNAYDDTRPPFLSYTGDDDTITDDYCRTEGEDDRRSVSD